MDKFFQVISYYPNKDQITIKNFASVSDALKEYDSVIEDFREMYGNTIVSETSLRYRDNDTIAETRMLLDEYYANAYSSVEEINLSMIKK